MSGNNNHATQYTIVSESRVKATRERMSDTRREGSREMDLLCGGHIWLSSYTLGRIAQLHIILYTVTQHWHMGIELVGSPCATVSAPGETSSDRPRLIFAVANYRLSLTISWVGKKLLASAHTTASTSWEIPPFCTGTEVNHPMLKVPTNNYRHHSSKNTTYAACHCAERCHHQLVLLLNYD